MKANFVWDLPDLQAATGRAARRSAASSTTGSCPAIWTGVDGRAVHRRLQLPERRRQREPDRLAGLRRARAHRRRPGVGLQQRPVPAVQHVGVPGTAATTASGSSRATTTCEGCFTSVLDLAIARNIRLGGGRNDSAARRHVQRAERCGHHRPQHDDEPDEPERSGDRSRTCRTTRHGNPDADPRRGRAARGSASPRLPGAADGAGAGAVLLLTRTRGKREDTEKS